MEKRVLSVFSSVSVLVSQRLGGALCDARTAASCVLCHRAAVCSSTGSHDSTRSTHFFQVVSRFSPFTVRNSPSTFAAFRNLACDRLMPAPPSASGPNGPGYIQCVTSLPETMCGDANSESTPEVSATYVLVM